MASQTLDALRRGDYVQMKKIKLSCGLSVLPDELYSCQQLEILDLSGNKLSSLSRDLTRLTALKILFLSDNQFKRYPEVLADMPGLEMIAFKNNGMTEIPEKSLTRNLRWLILTNNKISRLPKCIGECSSMQKLMLAGNSLVELPHEMSNLGNLELLRLSVNQLTSLPAWLFKLPRLSFLAFSGNPIQDIISTRHEMREVAWSDFEIGRVLGEGASGTIHEARYISQDTKVAIKLFKGQITSDGSPRIKQTCMLNVMADSLVDEMNACIKAGSFPDIIDTIAKVSHHPGGREALVLELIAPSYTILGQPPSFASCTRDCFPDGTMYTWSRTIRILASVAAAAAFLHSQGVLHGDLYAHNTLVNESGHALLGDFGAATCYGTDHIAASALQKIEVRAFGFMIDDLLSRCQADSSHAKQVEELWQLCRDCLQPDVHARPDFQTVLRIVHSFE